MIFGILIPALVVGMALCLSLPSPAWAQFDFADALAVKMRTYPVKRSDGKPVPGPDGMPQPEAMSGGKPAKLKEFPDFPVDENFPGGSILASLVYYQKLDPVGVLEPVLAVLQNGYLEIDIVKRCRVDFVKIQFDQKPTKEVPSFREHGVAALMKIIADGAMAADLLRTHNDLRDRYNSGLSKAPKADQDNMAGLRALRQLIALWYNPRVVSLAYKDLSYREAKERYKTEVSKGQALEADLIMGPLRLAMKGRVEQRTTRPAPAGCPGARADAARPAIGRHSERELAARAIIRKVSLAGERLTARGGERYLESLKAGLAPNGHSGNGRSHNGASKAAGISPGEDGSERVPRIPGLKRAALGGLYVSPVLTIGFFDRNGDKVVKGYANFYGQINYTQQVNVQDNWKQNKDSGLTFGYDPDDWQYGLTYNIGQGDGGARQGDQPKGLIHWSLQGADQSIKATIDHLIQIYNDRNKYPQLTGDDIKNIAKTIHDLIRLRYAWGTMTADDVFIWRKVWRQGMEPDAAKELLDIMKEGGMKAEDLISMGPEQEEQQVAQFVEDKKKEQYVAYFAQPFVQTVSFYQAETTFAKLSDVIVLTREDYANMKYAYEYDEIVDAYMDGEISFWEAMEETTSLKWEYSAFLRNGPQVVYVEQRFDEDGYVYYRDLSGAFVNVEYGFNTNSWAIPAYAPNGGTNYVVEKGIWNTQRIMVTGPCVKGQESFKPEDDAALGYYVAIKYAFSPPKHIGLALVDYLYPEEETLSGGLSTCQDPGLREELDTTWYNDATPNDPHFASKGSWGQEYSDQWALQRIGFKVLEDKASAWHITTGTERPVVVAVIDTGIDITHPDIHIDNLWVNQKEIPGNQRDDDGNGYIDDLIGWNFVHNNNNPFDVVGHGTHVAGIIAARWNNGRGIAGMNRGVRIMALRAFNGIGRGWGSNVARAVIYAVDNGAQIINISASHEGHTKFMEYAFNYARQKGVLVVVSAGNKGKDTKGFEASNQPGALSVAATLPDDKRASFSNWGQEVDVAAPGVDVLSLRATNTDLIPTMAESPEKVEPGQAVVGADKQYYRAGGTSFATPLVAGLASLIWAKDPKLTAEQVARVIRQSANDIEVPGWDQFTGYGLVDARAALSADPNYYLIAKMHGLQGAQLEGAPVVQVLGTVDGSSLAGYEVDVGQGEEPTEWRKVSESSGKKIINGVAANLKPEDFGGPGVWSVRIIAKDKGGRTRESRGIITLQ